MFWTKPRAFLGRNIGVRNFWGGMDRRSFRWHYGLIVINMFILASGLLMTGIDHGFWPIPMFAVLWLGRRYYLVNKEYSISLYLFWLHVKLVCWVLVALLLRKVRINPVRFMPLYYVSLDEVKYTEAGERVVLSRKMLVLTPPELMHLTYKTSVEPNAELSV